MFFSHLILKIIKYNLYETFKILKECLKNNKIKIDFMNNYIKDLEHPNILYKE